MGHKFVCHLLSNGTGFLQNNKGPRMGPWGTPQVREATGEEAFLITTETVLFNKYELNPVSLTPAHLSK